MICVQGGWTPMHRAAMSGHKEVAEWLFSAGASVSDTDEVCC